MGAPFASRLLHLGTCQGACKWDASVVPLAQGACIPLASGLHQEETSGAAQKKMGMLLVFLAVFVPFWSSPGPGVAGNGFPDLSLLKMGRF